MGGRLEEVREDEEAVDADAFLVRFAFWGLNDGKMEFVDLPVPELVVLRLFPLRAVFFTLSGLELDRPYFRTRDSAMDSVLFIKDMADGTERSLDEGGADNNGWS